MAHAASRKGPRWVSPLHPTVAKPVEGFCVCASAGPSMGDGSRGEAGGGPSMLPAGFEPASEAREASILDH